MTQSLGQAESLVGAALLETHPLDYPSPTTPSISQNRIHQDALVAPFGADVWPMNALANDPSRPLPRLRFDGWPEAFRDSAKHLAYVLINYGNPEILTDEAHGNYVKWPQAGTIENLLGQLKDHVDWLLGEWSDRHPDTPVQTPRDLDSEHFNDCRRRVDNSGSSVDSKRKRLECLVRVWHLNPWLPEGLQWPEPTWRHEAWKPRSGVHENATKRLSQATMGPLLEWSIAFVTTFCDDIFSAHANYHGRTDNLPAGEDQYHAARTILQEYVRTETPLPAAPAWSGTKRAGEVGWSVLSYRHRIDTLYMSRSLARMLVRPPVSDNASLTALDFKVDGLFHGRPWTPSIGVYDVKPRSISRNTLPGPLLGHLRTAAIIVSGYLTGARPEEICGWSHGAAPAPVERHGGSRLHLIHGRVWKGSRATESGTLGNGQEAVWATIPIATKAIHVAEQIGQLFGNDDGLLFSDTGRQTAPSTVAIWIRDFVCFINERLVPHCVNAQALQIPEDPDGAITLRRFRRTLAWFIHNRPNGETTTAIQYQHLGTVIGRGYAGTKEAGMNDLLLEEDWSHRRRTVDHLRGLLDSGEGLSGPAADRAFSATERLPRHLTPADERRLRKDGTLLIYDNPAAVALCVYDERRALCHKIKLAGKDSQPSLLECVDGCLNCARTDGQLQKLESEAAAFQTNATLSPLPLAQAFLARSERNLLIVSQHRSNRICRDNSAPPESVSDE